MEARKRLISLALWLCALLLPAAGSCGSAERCLVWYQRPALRVVEAWVDGERLDLRATDGAQRPLSAVPEGYARPDELEVWVVTEEDRSRFVVAAGRLLRVERLALDSVTPLAGEPSLPPRPSPLHDWLEEALKTLRAPTPSSSMEESSVDDLAERFLRGPSPRPSEGKGRDPLDAEVDRILAEEALELAATRPIREDEEGSVPSLDSVPAATPKGDGGSTNQELRAGHDASRFESPNSVPPTDDTTTDLFLEWTWERHLAPKGRRKLDLTNRLYGGNRYVEEQFRGDWRFRLRRETELQVIGDVLYHDVLDEEADSEEDSMDAKVEVALERKLRRDWVGRFHGERSSKSYGKETTYGFDMQYWATALSFERSRLRSTITVDIEGEETRYPSDPGSDHRRQAATLAMRRELGPALALHYDYDHETQDYPEDGVSLTSTTTGADSLVNGHALKLEWNAFGKGAFLLEWSEENTNYRQPDEVSFSNRSRALEPGFTYAADLRWTFGLHHRWEKRNHRDADLDDGRVGTVIDETEQDYEKRSTRIEASYYDERWTGSLSLAWGSVSYPHADEDPSSLYADASLLELFLSASYRWRKDTTVNLSFSRAREGHPGAPVNDSATETLSLDLTRRF